MNNDFNGIKLQPNQDPEINQPNQPNQPQEPVPPPTDLPRPLKIAVSLGMGSLIGYGIYGIVRLCNKYSWISNPTGAAIRPFPYVLTGLACTAIIEAASLTYDVALYVLGERGVYENLEQGKEASAFDRLRQRTWKVIGKVEKLQQNIDAVFSRTVRIRTEKEIIEQKIEDKDLALVEIVRRAFKQQCGETFSGVLPYEMGIYCVTSLGYSLLLPQITIGWHAFFFLNGVILKVMNVYTEIRNKELEVEAQQQPELINNQAEVNNNDVPNNLEK